MIYFIYDGDCGFCQKTSKKIIKWYKGNITAIPFSHNLMSEIGFKGNEVLMPEKFVYVYDTKSGILSRGYDAFEYICTTNEKTLWVSRIMNNIFIKHVGRFVYRIVAMNRHRFPGSQGSCKI